MNPRRRDRADFVPLPENRSAWRAARRLAARSERPPFPLLYIHGNTGTGKSHLVREFVASVLRRRHAVTIQTVAALDLDRWMLSPNDEAAVLELRHCDILIIEDVQNLTARSSDGVAHLLESRQSRQLAQIVTGSVGPANLDLPYRLTSRLAGGLVTMCEAIGPASRRELAVHFLALRNTIVAPDVLDWLVAQVGGGVRPILGGVARLEAMAKLFPPPLTMDAVAAATAGEPADDTPIVERITERVSAFYRVTPKLMRGRDRHRQTLWARQVGMYLARQLTRLSLAQIGAYFGRDHTTVMHACEKVTGRIAEDVVVAADVRQLSAELG